jgi:hypothetical protein
LLQVIWERGWIDE